jgi:hypothetical protein
VITGDFIDDSPILGCHVQGERLVSVYEDRTELAKYIPPEAYPVDSGSAICSV